MKNVTDIQELIKNQEKLCIFVDYNHFAENFERIHTTEARESRDFRILQNFLDCDFLKAHVITKKNTPQKAINKLETKFPRLEFFKYDKNKFQDICSAHKDDYTFVYIGNNEDIINMSDFQDGYTILLDWALKQKNKKVDFQLSITELLDLFVETNNLCL